MNRIFNYCTILLVSVLAFALASCTEEYEYTGATVEGEQVYFSNTLSSTVELTLNDNTFKIPVNRIQKEGELTVQLNVSKSEGNNFVIPSEVTFADGDSIAYVTIGYDNTAIEYGKYDDITLSIANSEYTSPYGASSYTFQAGMSEWKTMEGKAWFRDGLLCTAYGLDVLSYQVEIQESVITPGRYRLVNPYGSSSDFYKKYGYDGSEGFVADGDCYIIIDATDPDYVYVDEAFYPGVYWQEASGKESLLFYSYVMFYKANGYSIETIKNGAPDIFGTLEDGVITMPANSLLFEVGTTEITGSGVYYANNDGLFAVALPGYEITDYSSSFTYKGRFTDIANNDYAQGTITLGADVVTAKYVVAADGDDVTAIIEGINDGSVESTEITASGDVNIKLDESGNYIMIVVTYDAEGNMKGSSATSFTFKSSKDNVAEASWKPLYTGTFTYNWYPAFITDRETGEPVGSISDATEDAVLYYDENDPTHYKVYPWLNNEEGLVFTMDNNTKDISFLDVETGYTYDQYGAIYASDAYSLLPTSFTSATSFYEDGAFYFGTIYYVTQGYLFGSYELFEITGNASNSPVKVNAIENGMRKSPKIRPVKIVKPIRKKVNPSDLRLR